MSKKINFVLKFTFFFLFSVFLLCSLMFLFTNKKILLQEMKNASYFKNLSISIKEEMKNYMNQSGFEEKILENIFTEEDIYIEIEKKVNGIEEKIETEKIEQKLTNNIEKYLQEKQLVAEEESLKKFANQLIQVYQEEIDLYQYSNTIFYSVNKINSYLYKIVLGLFLLCIILFLYLKKKKESIPWISISFFLYFIVFYIKTEIDIEHILILHPVFSEFLKIYILKILEGITKTSILLYIIGSIFLTFRIKKALKTECE